MHAVIPLIIPGGLRAASALRNTSGGVLPARKCRFSPVPVCPRVRNACRISRGPSGFMGYASLPVGSMVDFFGVCR